MLDEVARPEGLSEAHVPSPLSLDELERAPGRHHIVQFYERDEFLFDHVARFLDGGLTAGEPIVVVTGEAQREQLWARLGHDAIDRARAAGQLTWFDAHELLGQLLVGGLPDRARFQTLVVDALKKLSGGRRVRGYGEMVSLLWRDGNRAGALQLEELWNELLRTQPLSILCAYVIDDVCGAGDGEAFHELCRAHTHVVPTERYSAVADREARLRQISFWEQRARSLEHEIERRKELERTVLAALEREREAAAREKLLREEAERTVHYNELFTDMLGHDLRNPLGAILVGANYIVRANAGEKPTRAASRIIASSERMARMIDQLLDFSRIRVGDGLALKRTCIDLAEVCFGVKEELEAANPDGLIQLESSGHTVGDWDYERIVQVFANLIGNAISHGAPGGAVRVRIESHLEWVTAVVHNEGVVAPEVLPVMFEPFRGGAKLLKTEGLGLGLYITRQIVAAHGGAVEVTSNDELGTLVRVSLPRAKVAANDPLDRLERHGAEDDRRRRR